MKFSLLFSDLVFRDLVFRETIAETTSQTYSRSRGPVPNSIIGLIATAGKDMATTSATSRGN